VLDAGGGRMITDTVTIRKAKATLRDVERAAPLFDAYRQFYGQAPNLELARDFLQERLERNESTVFLADQGNATVGFAQLYQSFSSGAAARILILNDLYVVPESRRSGIGRWLVTAALKHAEDVKAARVTLSTGIDNFAAKALYDAVGFQPDTSFHVFHYVLGR
jgi:ribosomal protein S18 acetylase RimI-like enzyme